MTSLLNPFVVLRREQKQNLLRMILANKNLDTEQLLALFSLKTGLKRRTVQEYWDELEAAGVIENGLRSVDPASSERGRKAAKLANERRARDGTASKRNRARSKKLSNKKKIKGSRKKDSSDRPKVCKAHSRAARTHRRKKTLKHEN